jgi:3-hydroxybutyryl-CoA dehydrogenase
MEPNEVRSVAVIGCGIMGSGITEVIARSGIDVTVVEVDEAALSRGRKRVERSAGKALERQKYTQEEHDAMLGRLTWTTDFGDVGGADLAIEAATEDRSLKLEVFRRLDHITRPEIVLASNTSSIPITDLATATARPEKVIGTHFFNPPPILKLLELVRGVTTSDETVEFARAFGERIGKTVVLSKDRAGFIVNFLLIPYLNSAVRMLDEGFATKEDIDAAVQLGLGHPMGPLTLLDLIGLDTAVQVSNVLWDEFRDPIYAPPAMLKRMVAAGYLGRKSGKGFYDYAANGR